MNVIAYADEWAEAERGPGPTWDSNAVHAAIQRRATENHPMYLGIVNAVTYDSKTDRYIVKFHQSSAKVTDEVAQFLLEQKAASTGSFGGGSLPAVYAHMEKGVIDGVLLLFLRKE